MSYQSQFNIEFSKSCYGGGHEIISLVDNLMLYNWNLGYDKNILILDKGDDYDFVNLPFTLSSLYQIYTLLKYKEINREFIRLSFQYKEILRGIELTFDYNRENVVHFSLQMEDESLRILDPIKEMNNYLELFYKPISQWRSLTSVQYITGFDYSVILEIQGDEILNYIKNNFKNTLIYK